MEVKDLKPELIWKCFDEITKIPRPSCHEEQIRDFLLKFAADHNIEVRTDKVGNVVMSKPATPGHESAPTVSRHSPRKSLRHLLSQDSEALCLLSCLCQDSAHPQDRSLRLR